MNVFVYRIYRSTCAVYTIFAFFLKLSNWICLLIHEAHFRQRKLMSNVCRMFVISHILYALVRNATTRMLGISGNIANWRLWHLRVPQPTSFVILRQLHACGSKSQACAPLQNFMALNALCSRMPWGHPPLFWTLKCAQLLRVLLFRCRVWERLR